MKWCGVVLILGLVGCSSPTSPSPDTRAVSWTFVKAERTRMFLDLGPTARSNVPWLEVQADGHVVARANPLAVSRSGSVSNEQQIIGVCQAGRELPCRPGWRP